MDFRALAERFAVSGGDIKNAVLKAATIAAASPGLNDAKRITQAQLERAMEDVIAGRGVMQQSLFPDEAESSEDRLMRAIQAAEVRWQKSAQVAILLGAGAAVLALVAAVIALVR